MESSTTEQTELDPDLRVGEQIGGQGDHGSSEAMKLVADSPGSATPEQKQDALDWLLADDEESEEETPVYPLEINVSTNPREPKWVTWHIKPIASGRLDQLRRMFQVPVNRQQRRAGQQADLDASRFNAALVFEATVYPDLIEVMNKKGERNGAEYVMNRFRNKPLLVDQIAGEVLQRSGGDEADVRDATEIRAAGN